LFLFRPRAIRHQRVLLRASRLSICQLPA